MQFLLAHACNTTHKTFILLSCFLRCEASSCPIWFEFWNNKLKKSLNWCFIFFNGKLVLTGFFTFISFFHSINVHFCTITVKLNEEILMPVSIIIAVFFDPHLQMSNPLRSREIIHSRVPRTLRYVTKRRIEEGF